MRFDTKKSVGTVLAAMTLGSCTAGWAIIVDQPPAFAVAPSWVNVGSAAFTAGAASGPKIAIDSKGTPYVLYSNTNNTYKLTAMKYTGSTWTNVGAAGFSSDYAYVNDFAIDGNDVPYAAYKDGDHSDGVTVMKFTGSWSAVGAAGFSNAAHGVTLAFDGSNMPYVAAVDGSSGSSGYLSVLKYDGSWSAVGAASLPSDLVSSGKIAVDSSNKPYVAYAKFSTLKANMITYDGATWGLVGSADFSPSTTGLAALVMGSGDTPYVAFAEQSTYKATVMGYGGAWGFVGAQNFSPGTIAGMDMALDSSGTPYVVIVDVASSGKGTVMKFDGSGWTAVGTPGFTPGNIPSATIAFDGSDTLYVVYQDYSDFSSRASAMKYVQPLSVQENTTAVADINATDDLDTVSYSISGTDSALFDIDGSSGVLSFKTAPDFENPQDLNGDNIYVLTVTASAGGQHTGKQVHVTVTDDPDESTATFLPAVNMYLMD